MDIKKSYVYKGIRKAALESLFSLRMLGCCISMIFLVLLIYGLFFKFDLDENPNIIFPLFFVVLGLIVLSVIGFPRLLCSVIALFSPEKSIVATRYADIISFEEMCERVEVQYPQPMLPMRRWGLNALTDFIIYESYGDFAVIPYSAILDVQSCWPLTRDAEDVFSQESYVAIQDTFSHQYLIRCIDSGEEVDLIHALKDVLQRVRNKGNCL